MLSAEIGAFVAQAVSDPTSIKGLDLAEEKIDQVLKVIKAEQDNLSVTRFQNHGHIESTSFGGAESAPRLSSDYMRAYQVIGATLEGVKQDMEDFQEACRQAKKIIASTDEDSSTRMKANQVALDELVSGQRPDHGHRAYRNAQQNQPTQQQGPMPEGSA